MSQKHTKEGPVYKFTITVDHEVIWGHLDRKLSDATEVTLVDKARYDKAISLLFRLRDLTEADLSNYSREQINHVLGQLEKVAKIENLEVGSDE